MIVKRRVHKIMTVKQFCEKYPWPTEQALRKYILRAEKYNLEEAFIKIGRSVVIDVYRFFECVRKQNMKNKKKKVSE